MKDKKTGLRKEIILITSIALLIISITSSGTKLYFSIPSALVCFLCETYGLANRTQNKKYKFIFSVFSPFCFLFLHFWLLYLCKDPSTMMKRAHSSYIIAIVIIALLDIWYSSLISEKVQPPIVQQIDFSEIPAPVENITSDEPVQTMNEHIELYNDKFDYMTGPDFEVYCADLLRKNGFIDVSVTSTSGDFGADIIATQNKIKYAIQCKCYSSDIGVDAVYQVTGGMKYYDANVGVVLTNRYFTRQAKELASKIGIVLWDRDFLISLIDSKADIVSDARIPRQEDGTCNRDAHFEEAGKLIIEKGNAYVGLLQRTFKIGFNRAARIMDQLCDAGVIGPENGTKPRKILMSMEEFEEYLKNH